MQTQQKNAHSVRPPPKETAEFHIIEKLFWPNPLFVGVGQIMKRTSKNLQFSTLSVNINIF